MVAPLRKLWLSAIGQAPARGNETEYWAFLSYSHRDEAAVVRLQKALERYRIPKDLVGEETEAGTVPKRLFPCFRDNTEIGPAPEMRLALEQALGESKSLIVIASPHSSASEWVEKEILAFKRMGRANRIFVALAHGTPPDALPRALRFQTDVDGALTDKPAVPRWIDLAKGRFHHRVIELVSGVIGVDFDRLLRRDRVRARKRAAAWGAVMIALSLSVGSVVLRAQSTRLANRGGENPIARVENARAALRLWPSVDADSALRTALASFHERTRVELGDRPTDQDFSSTTGRVALIVNEQVGLWEPERRDSVRWLSEASDAVDHVRISQDGTTVVAWGDQTVFVWDAGRGGASTRLMAPRALATVAVSPDGTDVFMALADGVIQHWASPWSARLAQVDMGTAPTVFEVSPFGNLAVIGGADGSIARWAWRDRRFDTWEGHRFSVSALAFNNAGDAFVTGDGDTGPRMWNTSSMELEWEGTAPRASVGKFAFSPDGRQLAAFLDDGSGDDARRVLLWEWASDPSPREFVEHEDRIQDLDFSPDGRLLAAAGRDAKGILWPNRSQLGSVAAVDSLMGHTEGGISMLRFLRSPREGIVTVGGDGTLRVWDWQGGLVPTMIAAGSPRFAVHPEGERVLTVGSDGVLSVWDARRGLPVWESSIGENIRFVDAVFSQNDVVALNAQGVVAVYTCVQNECETQAQNRESSPSPVRYLTTGPGGETIMGISIRGEVFALTPDQEFVPVAQGPRGSLVRLDPSGDRAAIYGRGGFAHLVASDGNSPPINFTGIEGRVTDLSFSPLGRRIVTASEDSRVRVWDSRSGTLDIQDSLPAGLLPTHALFESESVVLVTGDSVVWRWDLQDGDMRETATHTGAVSALAFSPASDWIASGATDGSVYLTRAGGSERSRRTVLAAHGSAILGLQFDRSGERLFTRDEHQRVRVFAVGLKVVQQIADSLINFSSP